MTKIFFIPTIVAIALTISACNSCNTNKSNNETEELALDFESINIIDSTDAVFYALPSPEEIITYINDNDVSFNAKLMHDPKEAKLYEGYDKKTLACGVYFANLAYIATFKKSDFAAEYLSAVDYLLTELNINPNFTPEQQKRIINTSIEPDSMYAISRELYDNVISYLQEYDQGRTLSLLAVGTFTESLYLTTSTHKDFDKQKLAINRIAEQKLLFEDIVTMAKTYQHSTVFEQLIQDLNILEKSFDNLNINFGESEATLQANGTLHIESKNEATITEENYYIFSDNVQDFRHKLTSQ